MDTTHQDVSAKWDTSARGAAGRRDGMTLVEMLVATALTLVLVYSLAEGFAIVAKTVSRNRATLELSGQLRGVAMRLQQDLEGVTVPLHPWPDSSAAMGYFEYFEGPEADYDSSRNDSTVGDVDDVLMFTCRSLDQPFTGRIRAEIVGGTAGEYVIITSKVAEIIWWVQWEDHNGNGAWDWDLGERYRLHRRVRLVRPDLNILVAATNRRNLRWGDPTQLQAFLRENDLSVRAVDTSTPQDGTADILVANSLESLANRANRFAHIGSFPSRMDRTALSNGVVLLDGGYSIPRSDPLSSADDFYGEDVAISHLVAFDVKAYDPTARLSSDSTATQALSPGDPGYGVCGGSDVGAGTFVDLNYARNLPANLQRRVHSAFSGRPAPRSQLFYNNAPLPTYDTWAFDYEHDGWDQDGDGETDTNGNLTWQADNIDNDGDGLVDEGIDEGTNGFDDDDSGGVDDFTERETSPPYPVPLRGVQIWMRIVDPDSRQVRQVTISSDFTPE